MWETIIRAGSVLGSLTFVAAVITAFAMRRKVHSEATKLDVDAVAVLNETAASAVTEVRADMAELRADHREEIAEMKQEMRAMRRHITLMEGLLRQHSIPVPEFAWPPVA